MFDDLADEGDLSSLPTVNRVAIFIAACLRALQNLLDRHGQDATLGVAFLSAACEHKPRTTLFTRARRTTPLRKQVHTDGHMQRKGGTSVTTVFAVKLRRLHVSAATLVTIACSRKMPACIRKLGRAVRITEACERSDLMRTHGLQRATCPCVTKRATHCLWIYHLPPGTAL
jgi:hypothetical protein